MTEKRAKFCFQCGRRVDHTRDNCWYCNAPIHRKLRPDRKCPFCGGTVPTSAIKCIHCKEWLDGRPREEVAPVSQVVYMVDPTMLQGGHEQRLLGGHPVPRQIAHQLSRDTVRAIEENDPRMIDQPGIKMLEAPADAVDEVLDADVVDASEFQPVGMLPAPEGAPEGEPEPEGREAESRDLVHREGGLARTGEGAGGGANLPALRGETPQAVAAKVGLTMGKAIGSAARWLVRNAPGRKGPGGGETLETQMDERYRVCENCATEILTADNYCYACGMQYHMTQADEKKRKKVAYPSNFGNYLVVIVMLAALVALDFVKVELPGYVPHILGAVAAFFSLMAFVQRRSSFSQVFSLVLLIATAVIYFRFV